MSNYSKTTDFEAKDSLPTGDSGKIIRGAEFETEFDAISTAIATKADTAGPTFTGTLTFETISDGTIGVTAFVDEDNMASNSATLVPTQQSVKAYVDSQVGANNELSEILANGNTTGGTNIVFGDSASVSDDRLVFGAGSDLQIYHSGVHSYIDDAGTGNLTLRGNASVRVEKYEGEILADFAADGAVSLYHDNSVKIATTSTGVNVTGNVAVSGTVDGRDVATDGTKLDGIEAGATADQTAAEIRTLVDSATDSNVFTDADHTKLDGIEANATADQTDAEIRAAVEAATDSNVFTDADHTKLDGIEASADVTDTTNVTAAGALMDSELTDITAVKSLDQGVATTDSPTFAGLTTTADVSFGDNDKAIFGAGSDLQIYHDGGNSRIYDQGTGALVMRSNQLNIQSPTGEKLAIFNQDNDVELYYDDSLKLSTTSTGIDVTGSVTADGLTVDGAGLIRDSGADAILTLQRTGSVTSGAKGAVGWKDSSDLYVSAIQTATDGADNAGSLYFRTDNDSTGNTGPYTLPLRMAIDSTGDISFYEDTGTTAKLEWLASDEDLKFADNSKAIFGAGSDLQIYHDGSNSIIADQGTGTLNLKGSAAVYVQATGTDEYMAAFSKDGPVQLYYDSAVKFSTTATGIDVTGTVTADGLTVSASPLIEAASAGIKLSETDTTDQNTLAYNNGGIFRISTANDAFSSFDTRLSIDHATGDISFYEDTGTTAKFYWDASAESLGIGTTSPAAPLAVEAGSAGTTVASFKNSGFFGLTITPQVGGSGAVTDIRLGAGESLSFSPSNTEAMRIDSSGNLLVGTTNSTHHTGSSDQGITLSKTFHGLMSASRSGAQPLILNRQTSDGTIADFRKDGSTVGSIGSTSGSMYIEGNPATSKVGLTFFGSSIEPRDAGAAADATVDLGASGTRFKDLYLSGGVQMGGNLDVVGQVSSYDNVGASYGTMNFRALDFVYKNAGGTQKMQLDSSGNLLVGQSTSTAPASDDTVGVAISPLGYISTHRTGVSAEFGRNNTDGDIVVLRKDGTSVGSIGTVNGDLLVGTGDTGLRFHDTDNRIYPINTSGGTKVDAAIDLGDPTARFKDLYLSGGAYLGGTAAANKLDDYEEGTFTPTLIGTTSGSATVTVTSANYTKVGNVVHVYGHISVDLSSHNIVGAVEIGGMPFNASTVDNGGGTAGYNAVVGDSVFFRSIGTRLRLTKGTTPSWQHTELQSGASSLFMFQATYRTA